MPLRNLKSRRLGSVFRLWPCNQRPWICLGLHCYFVNIEIDASSKTPNGRHAALCFSAHVLLFSAATCRPGLRHNANYVAYVQIPGCPLCSIFAHSTHVNPERSLRGTNCTARRAKWGGLRKGGPGGDASGGPPPEIFKNLYCKWCNLSYSWPIFVNTISLYCNNICIKSKF